MSNSNTPGLEVLLEEKETEIYNPDHSHDGTTTTTTTTTKTLETESLLPPLPSSSSSLPIEPANVAVEEIPKNTATQLTNVESYQVSTASLESMLQGVNIDHQSKVNKHNTNGSMNGLTNGPEHTVDPFIAERQYSQSLAREVYERSNSSSNLQSQGSDTNNSTRQGSVSSLNSTVSVSSNRALKKIKSGLRKLSSPLTLTPKMDLKEPVDDVDSPMELTDRSTLPVFKRPFLPRHTSTMSNASNSSSASSLNPLSQNKHSHTNSSASNRTGDNTSNYLSTPISSPVIAVNEKFGSGGFADVSEYQFPQLHQNGVESANLFEKFNLHQFDTIDDKVTYIESLKKQMDNEDAAYKITERRLLNSGWATENEILDLKKRRDVSLRHWKEIIDRLEDTLYRNKGS